MLAAPASFLLIALAIGAFAAEPRGLPPAPTPTAKFPGNDLHGLAPNDPRRAADMRALPWRALGRLDAGAVRCTAALVAPDVVLTAAHCVFDARTRANIAPADITFRLGYADGRDVAMARGRKLAVAAGYDPVLTIANLGSDWALVALERPLAAAADVLPLRERSPQAGDSVALGGYSRDRIDVLSVDAGCHVVGLEFDRDGMPLAAHDCSATHGASGAPLLIHDARGWSAVGVDVAARPGGGGVAALLVNARAMLVKLSP